MLGFLGANPHLRDMVSNLTGRILGRGDRVSDDDNPFESHGLGFDPRESTVDDDGAAARMEYWGTETPELNEVNFFLALMSPEETWATCDNGGHKCPMAVLCNQLD